MNFKKILIVLIPLLLICVVIEFAVIRLEVKTTDEFETIGVVEISDDRRAYQEKELRYLQSKANSKQEVNVFIDQQLKYRKPTFFKPNNSKWVFKKRGAYLLYQRAYGESYIKIVDADWSKSVIDKSHRVDESK